MINILKRSDTLKFPTNPISVSDSNSTQIYEEIVLTKYDPIFIGPISTESKSIKYRNTKITTNNPPIGLSQRKINSVPIIIDGFPIQNETEIKKPNNIKSNKIFIPSNNKTNENIIDKPNFQPTKSYPIKKNNYKEHDLYSEIDPKNIKPAFIDPIPTDITQIGTPNTFKPYNAIQKAKGSGILPYAIVDDKIYFLLQKTDNPCKKKDSGWNDFGGKINKSEHTVMAATREFSEETSCLFYLKEQTDEQSSLLYEKLKDNPSLSYDDESIEKLKQTINLSGQFFFDRINAYVNPIYVSSKEIYISYIIKVQYIPIADIPRAEDIHIPYRDRYVRECKWFSLDELMLLEEDDFHKRLQITKIKNRVKNYCDKGLLD